MHGINNDFEGTLEYTYDNYQWGIKVLSEKLKEYKIDYLCGISRGGLVPAVELSYKNDIPLVTLDPRSQNDVNNLYRLLTNKTLSVIMIDEIIDSGATVKRVHKLFDKEFQWACFVLNMDQDICKNAIHDWEIHRSTDKRYLKFHWDKH